MLKEQFLEYFQEPGLTVVFNSDNEHNRIAHKAINALVGKIHYEIAGEIRQHQQSFSQN